MQDTHCSDQLDPFVIERGLPAEREIGERNPGRYCIGVSEIQGRPVCSPPPPFHNSLIREVIWFLPPPLQRWISRLASNLEAVSIKTDIGQ
jgi:hypothetical protein